MNQQTANDLLELYTMLADWPVHSVKATIGGQSYEVCDARSVEDKLGIIVEKLDEILTRENLWPPD